MGEQSQSIIQRPFWFAEQDKENVSSELRPASTQWMHIAWSLSYVSYIHSTPPPSLPSITSPKNSMLTRSFSGRLGQIPFNRISYPRLPRLSHKLFWQRLVNRTTAPIRHTPRFKKANLRRLHRLPQHGQIFNHKHPSFKSCVQDRTYSWRNKGLAIYHTYSSHLFDRLSWHCTAKSGRFRCRDFAKRCGEDRECE